MTEPRYTHGHHASVLRSHSNRNIANSAAYLEPELRDDATLLDVGAGPGTITVDFARRVAHVTATELDDDALSLSRDLARGEGLHNIAFEVQDVHSLSFSDDSFDIVHAHQVLQHVADPVQALRELARVARPGGVVAVRDADYGGFIWHPQSPELDHWLVLYRAAARANGGEPDAGRHLLAWANAAGLHDAVATASVWNYADDDCRRWWGGMWADRILESAIARQLVGSGLADRPRLRAISAAWRDWAASPDGWFLVPHGELVWRKPGGPLR
ncbi:class I SAM-dependent methyltransferase [Microbacterium sp.]|uniref:class I SAM-dependent methyltransferase n=1 Tax=Microbacterium sp. TaxID=51671 RepID=UPI0037CCB1E3